MTTASPRSEGARASTRRHHGPYALPEAQSMLRPAGSALSRAHAPGLVHRDLQPENLFLAEARGEDVSLPARGAAAPLPAADLRTRLAHPG